jgi:D-serine deaminase-like pyridoxal phosphate-dependent protein
MQLAAGACGITVAKVSEAEIMADAGIDDIFIAYPVIGPVKLERLTRLAPRCRRLIVGIDSLAGAKALDEAARAAGLKLEVRLEVDIGFARTGIAGDAPLASPGPSVG